MREKIERNETIIKLLKEGWTYTAIMQELNIKSKGNIWQIVKRYKAKNPSLVIPS